MGAFRSNYGDPNHALTWARQITHQIRIDCAQGRASPQLKNGEAT